MSPPCSESEWLYLAGVPGAPEYFQKTKYAVHMNKICRGCYNERLIIKVKVNEKIRDQGGLEQKQPSQSERDDYARRAVDMLRTGRAGRIHGLKSAAAAELNDLLCCLTSLDDASGRWTVELLSGELKALKKDNIECSEEIDREFAAAKSVADAQKGPARARGGGGAAAGEEAKRPLGSKIVWPKIRGIHPGAVVRLKELQGAKELNGRKGRCITFDPETGRWKVDLGDGYKNLKVDNLQPAPTEKPPTAESAKVDGQEAAERAAKRSTMSAKERSSADYGWDD